MWRECVSPGDLVGLVADFVARLLTVVESNADPISWLTVPEVADRLKVSTGRVHRLLEEKVLAAAKVDGELKVPADFFVDDLPLSSLRGTLVVLGDSGYSDDETIHWLFMHDDELGERPIDSLRAGKKAQVRRIAQALAF